MRNAFRRFAGADFFEGTTSRTPLFGDSGNPPCWPESVLEEAGHAGKAQRVASWTRGEHAAVAPPGITIDEIDTEGPHGASIGRAVYEVRMQRKYSPAAATLFRNRCGARSVLLQSLALIQASAVALSAVLIRMRVVAIPCFFPAQVLRLDKSGKVRRLYMRRRDLIRQFDLLPRDLRRIDPTLSVTRCLHMLNHATSTPLRPGVLRRTRAWNRDLGKEGTR